MAKKSASSKGKSTKGAPAAAGGGGGRELAEPVVKAAAAPVPVVLAIDNGTTGDTTFELQRCQKVRIIGDNFTRYVTVYLADEEIRWVPFVIQNVRRKRRFYYNPQTPAIAPGIRDIVEVHAVPMLRPNVVMANKAPDDHLGGTGDVTGTVSNNPPKPSTKGSKKQGVQFTDPT
jgi:hypothetical protein